mmetsp:Transcript_43281/g.49893  ORF Transcript_43281/g.49893 Transcript_43281/m.49893 type:complete len:85 (-) Transcript_43281:183-437(-)
MTTAGVNNIKAITVTRIVKEDGTTSLCFHEVALRGVTGLDIDRNDVSEDDRDEDDDDDNDGGEPNDIVNGIRSLSAVRVVAQLL